MKKIIILRGLPGSGKSRHAATYNGVVCSADHFFEKDGEYNFDVTKLGQAHMECQRQAFTFMRDEVPLLVIDNTNSRRWEYMFYKDMATYFGYEIEVRVIGEISLEAVKEYAERNIHGVPEFKILEMAYRWEH